MIKPDKWILSWGAESCTPFNPAHVNPASYDITLSNRWVSPGHDARDSEVFKLWRHEPVLAASAEYIKMPPDVGAFLVLKSSMGRQWLDHSHSGWIDPGFEGNITLELSNLSNSIITLTAGTRVAQLVFFTLEEGPIHIYNGNYQGQRGPTLAVSHTLLTKV